MVVLSNIDGRHLVENCCAAEGMKWPLKGVVHEWSGRGSSVPHRLLQDKRSGKCQCITRLPAPVYTANAQLAAQFHAGMCTGLCRLVAAVAVDGLAVVSHKRLERPIPRASPAKLGLGRRGWSEAAGSSA